jgi:hypothetical protein
VWRQDPCDLAANFLKIGKLKKQPHHFYTCCFFYKTEHYPPAATRQPRGPMRQENVLCAAATIDFPLEKKLTFQAQFQRQRK